MIHFGLSFGYLDLEATEWWCLRLHGVNEERDGFFGL